MAGGEPGPAVHPIDSARESSARLLGPLDMRIALLAHEAEIEAQRPRTAATLWRLWRPRRDRPAGEPSPGPS